MFEIHRGEGGQVRLSGRLDAAEAEDALATLDRIDVSMTLDCSALEYVSSAGILQATTQGRTPPDARPDDPQGAQRLPLRGARPRAPDRMIRDTNFPTLRVY